MIRRRETRMAARSDGSGGGLKSAGVQRVIGVVALVVAALVIGAVRMGFIHLPGSHTDDSMLAQGTENGPGTPASTASPGTDTPDLDAPAVENPPVVATEGS